LNEPITINVLFICSRNQWRSPTAENVYRNRAGLKVRSRGTSSNARRSVSGEDLNWAQLIFVMENKHKARLCADFPGEMRFKEIHVLNIPDEFQYMDPELVEEITSNVEPILARHLE
jgi:predicted protein tyrosine phosphatase